MKSKKLMVLMPCLIAASVLVGCGGNSSSTSTNVLAVSNLETSYYVGDKLDTSKIKVNSVDSEGKTTEVSADNLEFSYTDTFKEVGPKTITVKDKSSGAKGAFTVNVLKDYEVDEEKYNSAMFKFLHSNMELKNSSFEVKYGSYDPVNYNFSYQRNGRQECLKKHDNTLEYRYLAKDNYYYNVVPCKKENKDITIFSVNSLGETYSLFDELMNDIDVPLVPFWFFNEFTLNNNQYTYVNTISAQDNKEVSSHSITFNKGEIKKISYNYKDIKNETKEVTEEMNVILEPDFTFDKQIFNDDIQDPEFDTISYTEPTFTNNIWTISLNKFNYGTDDADTSKLIDPANVQCFVYYEDASVAKEDKKHVFNCELTVDKEKDKRELHCSVNFDNCDAGKYYISLYMLNMEVKYDSIEVK